MTACGRTGDDTETLAEEMCAHDQFNTGPCGPCEWRARKVLASSWLAARDVRVAADAVAGVLALADERLTTIAANLIRASYDDDVERMAAALGNGSLAVKAEVTRLRAVVAPHTDTEEISAEEFDRRLDAGEPVELDTRNISAARSFVTTWPEHTDTEEGDRG